MKYKCDCGCIFFKVVKDEKRNIIWLTCANCGIQIKIEKG